ncbi:MAG: nuclear transport factor 2 family protein [Gammaproteobacteria bacterium]|nr:nuclear transport factor 2 family protein [Gammaproteobacteria bacterium]
MNRLDALCDYFEGLGLDTLPELERYYATDTWFKDPFHETRGVEAVRTILRHTFTKLPDARFRIERRFSDTGSHAVILWNMRFTMPITGKPACIQGATHLEFDGENKVVVHRDYWDAAEELYGQLPVLKWLMRGLARQAAAKL